MGKLKVIRLILIIAAIFTLEVAGIVSLSSQRVFNETAIAMQYGMPDAPADYYVEAGLSCLEDKDLICAFENFNMALSFEPLHEEANFWVGVLRIPYFYELNENGPGPGIDSFKELLDAFGVSPEGRSLFNFYATLPTDINGNVYLPHNSPTSGDLQRFLYDYVRPMALSSLENLSHVSDLFVSHLVYVNDWGFATTIEVDYGEVAAARALLEALLAGTYAADAYNLNLDIDNYLTDYYYNPSYLVQNIIDQNPNLLTLGHPGLLNDGKDFLNQAIASCNEASEFIRTEMSGVYPNPVGTDPDQSDDLLTFWSEDPVELQENLLADFHFRNIADSVSLATQGPTLIEDELIPLDDFVLNLTEFYDHPKDLRDFLPDFNFFSMPIFGTMPDPTLGGIVPNMTECDYYILASQGIPICQILLNSPPDGSWYSFPPTFMWTTGPNNRFIVEFSLTEDPFNIVYSSPILSGTTWTIPGAAWNRLPHGWGIFWRVRGADIWQSPLEIETSEDTWSVWRGW